LKAVFDALSAELPGATILVVDDASTDSSLSVALADRRVKVLSLPVNGGVGTALQAGFKFALKNGLDVAVKFDGDGQHRAEELPDLLRPIASGEADVVVGSRFLEKEEDGFRSTPMRRLGISLLNFANLLATGKHITDCTSGFRAYNKKAMQFLSVNYTSFDYPEPEEFVLLHKDGLTLLEVSTKMSPRLSGVSSISPVKSAYFMCKMLFCIFMASLRAPVVKGK